jgi:type VI secretion system protein VasJ
MLGLITSGNSWKWTICGKHPVAGDYFQFGSDDPLLVAFSDWMEKGYRFLKDIEKDSGRLVSWRFWAQGIKKDIIVCGVVKDSSDRIGRPYPILFTGTGILKDWKNHWDLLPFAFERTWTQMDYLCSKRYNNFKHFEEDLFNIRPPEPSWQNFAQNRKELYESYENSNGVIPWDIGEFRQQISRLGQIPHLYAYIDQGLASNILIPIGLWHTLMKDSLTKVPNSVFTGGTGDLIYLAVFMHALSANDFVGLWSNSNSP